MDPRVANPPYKQTKKPGYFCLVVKKIEKKNINEGFRYKLHYKYCDTVCSM